MHELAANVFETFKQVDKRYNAKMAHLFRITKTDLNREAMDLTG